MRVTSSSWDGEKIFSRDQVLEVRDAVPDARLHVASQNQGAGRVGPAAAALRSANSDRSRWCRRRKERPLCGAKTRAGGTCMVRVEFGRARCRFQRWRALWGPQLLRNSLSESYPFACKPPKVEEVTCCKIPGRSRRASIHRSHRPSANNAINRFYESSVTRSSIRSG
jgi:hypothetical protein